MRNVEVEFHGVDTCVIKLLNKPLYLKFNYRNITSFNFKNIIKIAKGELSDYSLIPVEEENRSKDILYFIKVDNSLVSLKIGNFDKFTEEYIESSDAFLPTFELMYRKSLEYEMYFADKKIYSANNVLIKFVNKYFCKLTFTVNFSKYKFEFYMAEKDIYIWYDIVDIVTNVKILFANFEIRYKDRIYVMLVKRDRVIFYLISCNKKFYEKKIIKVSSSSLSFVFQTILLTYKTLYPKE